MLTSLSTLMSSLVLAMASADGAAASAEWTTPSAPTSIAGGTDTEDFDSVVAIKGVGACTGVMIAPTLVLTAAHCFGENEGEIEVYFGAKTGGASTVAKRYGVHPSYCRTCAEEAAEFGYAYDERYDYAYVELREPYIPRDGFLIPLTDQQDWDDTMQIGNAVTLVGFGLTKAGESLPSVRSRRLVTTIIDRFSDNGLEFFAGQEGGERNTCNGDSGGPIIVMNREGEPRVAGITSRGTKNCSDGAWYGVAAVALQWIDDELDTEFLPADCESRYCLELELPEAPAMRCAAGRPTSRAAWTLLGLILWLRRRRRARGLETETNDFLAARRIDSPR